MKPIPLLLAPLLLFATTRAQNAIGRGPVAGLYNQHCAVCHGRNGEGGLGGSLISGEWQHADTDEAKARVIREGLPDLGMQGFDDTLDAEQIRALVIYMRELKTLADDDKGPRVNNDIHETEKLSYKLERIAENPSRMWSVDFLPDGRYLITEIDGALRFVDTDGTLREPVADTPDIVRHGQGGLLDVALHPDYADNGWVYLVYARGEGRNAMTSLVRGRVKDNRWIDHQDLFVAEPEDRRRAGVHFGSRIVFRDGYVFFSIGDRGAKPQAQSLDTPNGKIHRLHDDGRVPDDNPFIGETPYESIWSYGHRNPQGLAIHPDTGELWSTEHGPRGGDELNLILKGRNYGWPEVTFGMNYGGTPITEHTSLPGMEPPVWHWTPSIATCGLAFADGDAYPAWDGDLLAGGLAAQVLERLRVRDGKMIEREVLLKNAGRVRDVATAPDGVLHLILEAQGSTLVRLVPIDASK